MSDRITQIEAVGHPNRHGLQEWGAQTRQEMIDKYRAHYQRELEMAQAALAVPDEDLVVETFLGPYAMKNRKVVL